MQIDSLYILGQNGEVIAFKNYMGINHRKLALQFYSEFTKLQHDSNSSSSNNNSSNSTQSQQNNNSIQNQYPLIKLNEKYFSAFITSVDVIIVAIISQEVPILVIYNLLYHLLEVLKNSFKEQFCFEKLKGNFSSIFLMLDHFMDNGNLLVSQKFVLEELVRPNGVIEKIGDLVIGQNKQSDISFQALEKYADGLQSINNSSQWVVKDIEMDNQVLFDLIEYYDCQIDSKNNYLSEEINGELKVDAKVTNGVELNIFFSLPQPFDDISGNECLFEDDRLEKLQKERMLNCIPPTGQSSLLFYNISEMQNTRLPYEFIHSLDFNENETIINLKIEHRLVRGQAYTIEELHIKLVLPNEAKVQENTHSIGSIYEQDSSLVWKIGSLKQSEQGKLKVFLKPKEKGIDLSKFNFVACLRFSIPQFSLTGTKIDKVNIKKGPDGITKKAKTTTKSGYYEIRLN